jgi:dipeptidyl aminopeptidase/acylaminoacyl peptidase
MQKFKLFIGALGIVVVTSALAQQKKPIDTDAYLKWKTVEQPTISHKGNLVVYQESLLRGNTQLIIHHSNKDKTVFFERGKQAQIHPSELLVGFRIMPQYDSIRKLKLAQIPEKKHPKDSLGIYIIEKDTLIKFPKIQTFKMSQEALPQSTPWVIIQHADDYKIKGVVTTENKNIAAVRKKCAWRKANSQVVEIKDQFPKPNGHVLTFFNGDNLSKVQVSGVKEFELNYFGTHVLFTECIRYADTIDSCHLYRYHLAELKKEKICAIKGELTQLAISRDAASISYLATADTGAYKNYQLYLWTVGQKAPTLLIDTITQSFKPHQLVAKAARPTFSTDGNQLFFGVGNKSIAPAKDTLTKDEKYNVDIWHWNDARIQPHQMLNLKKEVQGYERWLFQLDSKKMIQLTDTSLDEIRFTSRINPKFGLVSSQTKYFKELTYDTWYYDYFRVDLKTGERKLLIEHYPGMQVYLSPRGTSCVYWEYNQACWRLIDLNTGGQVNITQQIPEQFREKYHDTPDLPSAIGKVYWLNEETFLIESQLNIWRVDGQNNRKNITNNSDPSMHFSVLNFERDSAYLSEHVLYLKSFNYRTKEEGVWLLIDGVLKPVFLESKHIVQFDKAKNSQQFILRQSTISQFPDVQFMDSLGGRKLVHVTNALQEEYNWATVELISWKSYSGDSLSGLLYKPQNYDSTKEYPLLVYYYERYTDNMHRYYAPRPTASIIFATEYCSNGYMVFMPDIPYITGKPAQSAFNAIMSGVDHVLKQYPNVDEKRMGLQGQSWGGYQTAQLITMTTRFKCAMAGAPVSNMFSAYGGIRWGSGLSRSFQYEKGQSRIGKTIWESPELYIENSPLFHLPNVQTPLLIMHNDNDGAVPWYQGIELYNGLRRLNKPVWLLNYNDDDHNLMKIANRIDLSIRMKSFFDYYLLGYPAPKWLSDGIPAMEKGKTHGY